MIMTRAFKHWMSSLMIGVILLVQMSVAAYACPGIASGKGPVSAMAATMVDCDQMDGPLDKANPGLCVEHCHPTQQSDQTQQVPALPAMLMISLYLIAPVVDASAPDGLMLAANAHLQAAPPPPLSVRHCCFRI
jgi:hypothetical protein